MRRGKPPERFRASLAVRLAVLAALLAWVTAGAALVSTGPAPAAALAGVASFVAFFLAFARFFWRLAYVVDERGVSYRGASRAVLFRWEDIVRVEASPVPLGGWYVSTRRGGFVLSGFVDGRDRLFELILARAGLFPT